MKSCLIFFCVLCVPGAAQAHGTLSGGGGFYAGVVHPFLAWEHLLLIITLGLLIGLNTQPINRLPLLAFAVGLFLGLTLGALQLYWTYAPGAILVSGVIAGCLVAAAVPPHTYCLSALSLLWSLGIGMDTGVPQSTSPNLVAVYAPYAGVFIGCFLILLNTVAIVSLARRPPYTIGVRIVGAWIAAACLMVLALALRPYIQGA